jgi:hypothetical protein
MLKTNKQTNKRKKERKENIVETGGLVVGHAFRSLAVVSQRTSDSYLKTSIRLISRLFSMMSSDGSVTRRGDCSRTAKQR